MYYVLISFQYLILNTHARPFFFLPFFFSLPFHVVMCLRSLVGRGPKSRPLFRRFLTASPSSRRLVRALEQALLALPNKASGETRK
jgi:hypothetical protein